MKWQIPAKTFLVGEYIALNAQPAIILTTTPCFQLTLGPPTQQKIIHQDSPAGKFLNDHHIADQVIWEDPYCGKGGMGASSAQFIGAYLACCYINNRQFDLRSLQNEYYKYSWNNRGLKPSGYDVIAQSHSRCVYINQEANIIRSYDWDFHDITFLLIHSGQKLATHEYLQNTVLPPAINKLANIVAEAEQAFIDNNSSQLVTAVNNYYYALLNNNLVAEHTLKYIKQLQQNQNILAAKGCGAMGADILMIIIEKKYLFITSQNLTNLGWHILASTQELFNDS